MNKDEKLYLQELEAKNQILEAENDLLSLKARENQLLTKIFEEVNLKQNPKEIYSDVVEHLSILLDVEYVGIFGIQKNKLIHINSYLSTEDEAINPQIEIPQIYFDKLSRGENCLLNNNFTFQYENQDFKPDELLIIPIPNKNTNENFLFARLDSSEALEDYIDLFMKIAGIIGLRLEHYDIDNRLIMLNEKLEQRVEQRTYKLKEEIKIREEVEKELIFQNEEYATLNEEYKSINNELSGAKLKIEESEARYKKLSNLTFEGIVIHENKIALDANLSFYNMFGYAKEEIIGKDIGELLLDKEYSTIVEQEIRAKRAASYEVVGIKKDGTKFPIELQVRFLDKEENIRVVAVRDISLRKKVQQELKKQDLRLQKILDTINVGIYLRKTDYSVVYVNPIMKKFVGSNLVGKKCYNAIFNFDHKCDFCFISNKVEAKEFAFTELKLKYKEFKVSTVLLDIDLVMVVFQDITKLKYTEQKLKNQNKELRIAKNKAEESDQLKSEFFQNISHEVRTPLNGIMGFTQLLKQSDLTDEKRDYFIEIIQKSGNQLLTIVDNLIEFSRLETEQVKLMSEEFNLNDLLSELLDIYKISTENELLEIRLNNGLSTSKAFIVSDRSKLHKIISNLLDNAIKFTKKGFVEFGYIVVKTGNLSRLKIYVKDSGIGINKDKLGMIFIRFSQEEKELSRKKGGLGLGLSIVKKNTELLGGKISVVSEKGQGSTFFVEIPLLKSNK